MEIWVGEKVSLLCGEWATLKLQVIQLPPPHPHPHPHPTFSLLTFEAQEHLALKQPNKRATGRRGVTERKGVGECVKDG